MLCLSSVLRIEAAFTFRMLVLIYYITEEINICRYLRTGC